MVGLFLQYPSAVLPARQMVKPSACALFSSTFLQNSARIGYATEGALFISVRMSTDAVSTLQKVWVIIRLLEQDSVQACMQT